MPKKKPQRMCVACRTMADKKSLIRLVITPEGDVVLDPVGKTPGRGAYVCRRRQCLDDAVRGRKLDRGLKTRVNEQVIDQLIRELEALPDEQAVSGAEVE